MKTGKTTRLVNRYINELFTDGVTFVYEGRNTVEEKSLKENAFKIFEKRMLSEHSDAQYNAEDTEVDRIKCYKVTLINQGHESIQHS